MRLIHLLGLVALVAGLGAAPASALPADKHLTVEADNGQGCLPDGKTDCYRLTEGSLDGFEQGMDVHVKLENVGSTGHNLFVTEQANADENNLDTSADDAINGTSTVPEGETRNLTFTIPSDAEGLYFWCDVQTHEAGGMWLEASVAEASEDSGNDGTGNESSPDGDGSSGGSGSEADPSGDGANGVPAAGLAATAAAVSAAALAGRTGRR